MSKPLTERLSDERLAGLADRYSAIATADKSWGEVAGALSELLSTRVVLSAQAKALEEARIALQKVHDVTIDTVVYGIARAWLTAHPEARESQPEAKRVPSSPRSN